MPNSAYKDLLEFLMPSWDSKDIDIELRIGGILGMQGTGKSTLAMTLANDLKSRYGNAFISLYGYWLHKLIPAAAAAHALEGKKGVLIVLEDATAMLHNMQSRKLLTEDMVYFWRLRHEIRDAGIETHTAKIALLINMHSYMTITKYLRNAHMLIVKSIVPKWQRYEHEDITLRWLDSVIAKQLTRMRFSGSIADVLAALNKALVVYHTGHTDIIKYEAKKRWPKDTYINEDVGVEEEASDEEQDINALIAENQALKKALRRLIDELNLRTKVDKTKYLRVKTNSHYISLGPIAHIIKENK